MSYAVFGIAVEGLVHKSGLEDRHHHISSSCWDLSLCKQAKIGLPQPCCLFLSALALSPHIPFPPSHLGHYILKGAQGAA